MAQSAVAVRAFPGDTYPAYSLEQERRLVSIFQALAADADNDYAMIDSTILRAHQHSAGAKKGGAMPRLWAQPRRAEQKIHAAVDVLGKSTGFHFAPGQTHDLDDADALLPDTPAAAVIAGRAYDTWAGVIKYHSDRGQRGCNFSKALPKTAA